MSTLTDKLANETLVTFDSSMKTLTEQLSQETLVELNTTMQSFSKTMRQMETALATAEGRLDPADPLTTELTNTMREFARMSVSIKALTDYLEAHPESLLRGR